MSLTVWNIESIKDVAEMLGIGNLADEPAAAIAMDLEYRIHQVVQVGFVKVDYEILLSLEEAKITKKLLLVFYDAFQFAR